jgi:hypothetical protein
LGVVLTESLSDLFASNDVKYDVREEAEAETLLPSVELDEDE